ncbi:hypothetical protein J1605_021112 [Eschrichtius robustus]|uniref:C2 domain-containing protein n=1 Tax=Eschrichtius robustus TaxID=9764 RepID=A0AB34HFZ0_ESCRO|nr:hypothetical protein J1605_021112 [Eschrichtius robustus]
MGTSLNILYVPSAFSGRAGFDMDANHIFPQGEKFPDKKPKVQLVITYEDAKLTILVKHMKNVHLPDGSTPSAHVEFYLLPYPSEVRRRKTKSVPKCTDPTYNEIVSMSQLLSSRFVFFLPFFSLTKYGKFTVIGSIIP